MASDFIKTVAKELEILPDEAEKIVCGIMCLRGISYEFQNYGKKVLNDILNYPIESNIVYYPCEIIELRQILVNKCIFNSRQLLLFSSGLAKKYLNNYAVLVGVEVKDAKNVGGLLVVEDNELQIDEIKRIYVKEDLKERELTQINKIVDDEAKSVQIDVMTNIRGLEEPAIAKAERYNLSKTADASAGKSWTNVQSPAAEREKEVTRTENSARSPFQVGDKLRLRSNSMAFSGQVVGRVTRIESNVATLEIQTGKYKGKKIKIDLLDAAKLSMTWEKI